MPSTYSPSLRLELIGNGEQAGNWGLTTNTNLGTLIEQAIAGVANVTMAGTTTLTVGNGVSDQSRNAVIILGGTLSGAENVIVPSVAKLYVIRNATSGGQTVTVKTAAGTGVALLNGYTQVMYCDGTNVTAASQSFNPAVAPGTVSSITLSTSGTGLTVNGGSSASVTTSGTFSVAGTLDVDNGGTGLTTLPSSGRFLISNGTGYASGTVASGNAISTSYNAGTGNIVVNNDGVTSLTAGSGILLSGSTGNVTITSTGGSGTSGVSSFSAGSTGFSPSVATTGAITLSGILATSAGGTGLTTFISQDRAIYSTSSSTLTAGTLPVVAGGTGLTTLTAANQALYSTSASALTTGTLPVVAGGSGATTLTGYLKGNGTSAFTASSTVPVADLSGSIGIANGGTGTTTAFTTGSIVFAGASGVYSQNNSNLFWSNSSTRLGIGTSSPSYTLHVAGQSFTSGSSFVGDANFYRDLSGTSAILNFDSTDYLLYARSTNALSFVSGGTTRFSCDSGGVFSFNSGYGTSAPAYGCRAWVNFSGTVIVIRASGNVSSITDNGVGDYTVNFINAMPDGNYSVGLACEEAPGANAPSFLCLKDGVSPATTSVRISARYGTSWTPIDITWGLVTITR